MITINISQMLSKMFTNDDFVKEWNNVCHKNKISMHDQDLIEASIVYRDQKGFERLCDKYSLSDYDRNALAGIVMGSMILKYGNQQ